MLSAKKGLWPQTVIAEYPRLVSDVGKNGDFREAHVANTEHLDRLSEGVAEWNAWRRRTAERPDLTGAKLKGARLAGVDLSYAILRDVDLCEADLSAANLSVSDLTRATLVGANLSHSQLRGADLTAADLRDTTFLHSDVTLAYFHMSVVDGADFDQARCFRTLFSALDLRGARNLDRIVHEGPSTLGLNTLERSRGLISPIFLRGVGSSDAMVSYAHQLSGARTAYHSCFISFSSKDERFAEHLYADLQKSGVRCWYAPKDLRIGEPFRQRIDSAISAQDKLVLVLSVNSVCSKWVEAEVEAALDKERHTKGFPCSGFEDRLWRSGGSIDRAGDERVCRADAAGREHAICFRAIRIRWDIRAR